MAYRYFATPRRKFIIADAPGHIQYTRNMVTGASTADLAIILVDARAGLLEQTHRHSFIAHLLGIKHMVVCVNKMDLVEWSEDRYNEMVDAFRSFSSQLDVPDIRSSPSAPCKGTTWWTGASTWRGTMGRRCFITWSTSTSPRTATCRIAVSRSNMSSGPQTDADRGFPRLRRPWPAGSSRWETMWSPCRR